MSMISINSSVVPTPSDFSVKLSDERKSIKTASGRLVTDLIGSNRRTLDFSYRHLSKTNAVSLMATLSSTDTLSVTYPDPITGATRTSTFLISVDRGMKSHPHFSNDMPWLDFSFSLEEVEF